MGGRTKIRANQDWPSLCVRQSIKCDVSVVEKDSGWIGHFGQSRTLHSSMEMNQASRLPHQEIVENPVIPNLADVT